VIRFKAVIFDLDGTLLDTLEDLAQCMNRVLARNGLPVHPKEAYRFFVGSGMEKLVARALPGQLRDKESLRRFKDDMMEEYAAHWHDHTEPYEGIESMLAALEEKGVTKTVFSNKPDPFVKCAVRRFFSRFSFAHVAGACDGVPIKPDPAGAVQIAEKVGVPTAEFLYAGDTGIDMKTAVAAEMFPVGVLWGFRDARELRDAGARLLVKKPEELAALC